MTLEVNCPTCQNKVAWNEKSEHRPFCSKRCQLIDLGEWSFENNKISSPMKVDAEISADMIEDIEAMLAANEQDFFKE